MTPQTIGEYFSEPSVTAFLEKAALAESLCDLDDLCAAFRAIIQEAVERANTEREAGSEITEDTQVTDEVMGEIRGALYNTTNIGLADMVQSRRGADLPVRRAAVVEQALRFVESFWRKR